jgi:hypothetical protein
VQWAVEARPPPRGKVAVGRLVPKKGRGLLSLLPTSGPVNPSPGAARTGIGGQAIGQQRRAVRRSPSTSGPSIAPAAQPGLGRQLSRRVASGEIDQAQAQRTAKERRELEGAYGSDWRQEIYGQDVQNLRLGLAGAHKNDPKYEAAMKAAKAARRKALERAREKAAGVVASGTAAA